MEMVAGGLENAQEQLNNAIISGSHFLGDSI
jgi:glycerol-3-phosphate responsive antiterminator